MPVPKAAERRTRCQASRAAAIAVAVCGLPFLIAAAEADDGQAIAPVRAEVAATVSRMRMNTPPRPAQTPPDANWWLYDVELLEKSGRTGVTLKTWRKCYQSPDMTLCEPWDTDIKRLFGTDRIPKGGAIRLLKPAWVWAEKTGYEYTISATYRGVDDRGHAVKAAYRFTITSQ